MARIQKKGRRRLFGGFPLLSHIILQIESNLEWKPKRGRRRKKECPRFFSCSSSFTLRNFYFPSSSFSMHIPNRERIQPGFGILPGDWTGKKFRFLSCFFRETELDKVPFFPFFFPGECAGVPFLFPEKFLGIDETPSPSRYLP